MKKSSGKLIAVTLLLLCSFKSNSQLPNSDPSYRLVFHDEFDRTYGKTPVNDKVWSRTMPWNQKSNYTDNVNWCFPGDTTSKYWDRAYTMKDIYDTTTVKVTNGTCKLITNKTFYNGRVSNWPECDPGRPGYSKNNKKCMDECKSGTDGLTRCWTIDTLPFKYTSGMLFSKQKFRKGFFEIRFRLPAPPQPPGTHKGFGPNFWLWSNNPPENYTSEIDVFEIFAFDPSKGDTNKYTSNVHYSDKKSPVHPTAYSEILGNRLKNDTAWHTAAAWWTDEFIKFYFDGTLYHTVQDRPDIAVDKLVAMYLIIDINSPTWVRCTNFDDSTAFPYIYEIDYVRVYQKK